MLIFRKQTYRFTKKTGFPISCNKTDPDTGRTPFLKEEEICDGVIHCPEAEDEEFERCKQQKALPESAIVKCESLWMDNVNIPAVKCNSHEECKEGKDEKDCDVPQWIYLVVFGSCLLISTVSSVIAFLYAKIEMKVDNDDLEIENSADCDVQAMVVNSTNTSLRKKACWVLFNRRLAEHDGDKAKALNNLKVGYLAVADTIIKKVLQSKIAFNIFCLM